MAYTRNMRIGISERNVANYLRKEATKAAATAGLGIYFHENTEIVKPEIKVAEFVLRKEQTRLNDVVVDVWSDRFPSAVDNFLDSYLVNIAQRPWCTPTIEGCTREYIQRVNDWFKGERNS